MKVQEVKSKNPLSLDVNQKINYRSWFWKSDDDRFFMRVNRIYASFLYNTNCDYSTEIPYHGSNKL